MLGFFWLTNDIVKMFLNQMSVKGCGRTRGCFRSCHGSDPNCPTTGTDAGLDYFVTMDTNKTDSSVGQNQVLFKMGGKLKRRKEVCQYDS